jgi:hypothetical protein
MTHVNYKGTFIFTPEGAAKCRWENPDAVVIQLITIDPAICRHRRAKIQRVLVRKNYRLPVGEQKNRDSFHWEYIRW